MRLPRCRAERDWLYEVTGMLHTLETDGYAALDFATKCAYGGNRIKAIETEKLKRQHQVTRAIQELETCPDPNNRMGKRQEQECSYYREQLVKDEERLADLEERGNEAVSAYDLRMGYDAEFNKQLKRNHIIYDLRQLERCPKVMFDVPQAVTEPSTHTAAPKESKPEPIARQATLFDVHNVM